MVRITIDLRDSDLLEKVLDNDKKDSLSKNYLSNSIILYLQQAARCFKEVDDKLRDDDSALPLPDLHFDIEDYNECLSINIKKVD